MGVTYNNVVLGRGMSLAAAASSPWIRWPGGTGLFEIVGTFATGATLTLQKKGLDGGSTPLAFGGDGVFSASGLRSINLPECDIRLLASVDTVSDLSAIIAPLRTDMAGLPIANASIGSDAASATNQAAVLALLANALTGDYEVVAANATAQVVGGTGAVGDYMAGYTVSPASLSPGAVILYDDSTEVQRFAGGTNSITTLHPFFVPIGAVSKNGAWKITTGDDVTAFPTGRFTA